MSDARASFRRLHESGCFMLPNPWDAGTALQLERLGFQALATTSAGLAFSLGLPDGAVGVEATLLHASEIVAATRLPVNADFENGYAPDPEGVAANVRRCVETGVAGLSIEDSTGNPEQPLFELPVALDRLRAARAAIDASGSGVLLTGRCEAFLVGHERPVEEVLHRLPLYAAAGADVLYAPSIRSLEDMTTVIAAVAPRPVNILMGGYSKLRLADLAAAGARRISVGSGLARAAWNGFLHAARGLAEGHFEGFEGSIPFADLNRLFRR